MTFGSRWNLFQPVRDLEGVEHEIAHRVVAVIAWTMITRLDHLVLTVGDPSRTVAFYTEVLGMREVTFGAGRRALSFGDQKINLHQKGCEFEPKAALPTPGSADLCFLSDTPLGRLIPELMAHGVEILEGPVARTGARGPTLSVYFRDPDGNLIEISNEATNPLELS